MSLWGMLAAGHYRAGSQLRQSRRNAAQGIARNSLAPAVSGKLPGLVVANLTDGEDDGGALCEARLSPDQYTPRRPEIVDRGPFCGRTRPESRTPSARLA